MALVVVLIFLVVGSVLFHILSPWWLTPIASNWSMIDDTINLTFWVTGFVFVAVNLFMAYAILRFRYKRNRRSVYEPENKKLEWWLTGLTSLGVIAMLAPGLFVWNKFVTVPEEAHEFEVLGRQWHWSFRYPGKDGVLGTTDASNINADNTFGLNADDPYGQDDVLISSNQMHLPINQPVKALLRSTDVLHNYTVAQFRVKMDLVPGLVSYLWFIPTRVGTFEILCEELCGMAHFAMRGSVVVEEEIAFERWLASYPTFSQTLKAQASTDVAAGKQHYAICASCHGAQGQGNLAMNAPKLSGQGDWYLRRQLKYYKQGVRGIHDQDIYGKLMAPMAATLVDDNAINDVVAYIDTLPDNPAPVTVKGDPVHGKKLYTACRNCHGADGQGVWSMNAPRQAGMSDWYLVLQLKYFKQGIRGAHPQDMYGQQMAFMAAILADDSAIDDVVSYINTLPKQSQLVAEHAPTENRE